jgi:methyl-accepting chemotaxis protein
MKESAREVEAGVSRAHSAGQSLDNILKAAESVSRQADEAGTAAAKVNAAATREMATNLSDLKQAVENIASVSEENSAAVKEVSAPQRKCWHRWNRSLRMLPR